MSINRRRAPKSSISRSKKLEGHKTEYEYSVLIGGSVISGVQKGDVLDSNGSLHSVKSGKKWQIFLYSYQRIQDSLYLNIFKPCLDVFPDSYSTYVKDREACISFKERYFHSHGAAATKKLLNEDIAKILGKNSYMESKNKLKEAVSLVCIKLLDKRFLRLLLEEAIFNNTEVRYLVIKDSTYAKDDLYKVFDREDVLNVLTDSLTPSMSVAGNVPVDYNVAGQKTLLRYKRSDGSYKNIIEIEVRNDSHNHYKQVRFNMYSKEALFLLLNDLRTNYGKKIIEGVIFYGEASKTFN